MSMKIYEIVTNKVLEKLEHGVIPWVKPWNDAKFEAAHNAETGRCYTGINRILLDEGGYLTFNQIKKLGYRLRKGSHSQIVTFWKFFDKVDAEGNETGKKVPMLRFYKVFSVNDIEGYKSKEIPALNHLLNFTPDEHAHNIANRYLIGDNIAYREGGNSAYYRPSEHSITMPKKLHFKTVEGYYATLFHECGHSTKKGLDRDTMNYGKEEGVAELCSAYLMQYLKMSNENLIENTADYISGWIKKLKDDPKAIMSIASKAEKAMDYILEVSENTEYTPINPLDIVDCPPIDMVASQYIPKAETTRTFYDVENSEYRQSLLKMTKEEIINLSFQTYFYDEAVIFLDEHSEAFLKEGITLDCLWRRFLKHSECLNQELKEFFSLQIETY